MKQSECAVLEYTRGRMQAYADSLLEVSRCFGRGERIEANVEGISRQELLEKAQKKEERRILRDYLQDLSENMNRCVKQMEELSYFTPKEEKRIRMGLKREHLLVEELFFSERDGNQRIAMTVSSRKVSGHTREEVAEILSALLKREMVVVGYSSEKIMDHSIYLVFSHKPRYFCVYGVAKAIKDGEKISGDALSVLEQEEGTLLAMLSDGMGSGEKAAAESSEVLDEMEKLAEAGLSMEEAANTINRLFLLEEENNSTLDLCRLDLISGKCRFMKIGGSASFIKSGGYVEKIGKESLPLGMLVEEESDFPAVYNQKMERELIHGDYILMLTDGVLEALNERGYERGFLHYLEQMRECHPKEMAERLLQYVLAAAEGRIRDDMTILIFKIYDRERI